MIVRPLLALALLCWLSVTAAAADYYVNNLTGNDSYDGRSPNVAGQTGPLATIALAVKRVKPGDTVHLAATGAIYRQSLSANNLQGEAEQPITFDGHGAWLTGADPLSPEKWVPSDKGPEGTLMLTGVTLPEPWWNTLCIDGKMGWSDSNQDALPPGAFYWWDAQKTLYWRLAPEQTAAAVEVGLPDGATVVLPPAKWGHTNFNSVPGLKRNRDLKQAPVWIKVDGEVAPLLTQPALDELPPGHFTGDGKTFYYHPPEGKTIGDMRLMIVLRSSGVSLSGANRHLVFKNFNVVYVGNDGYNIHGDSKEVTFLNCNAFYCGDEGFSSHDRCETVLDGGVFLQCASGIQNVNNSSTIARHVIVDSIGLRNDRQDQGSGIRPNEVSDTILIDCGLNTTETQADNILIVNGGLYLGADVTLKHVTAVAGKALMRVDRGSSVRLEECLLAVPDGRIHARMEDPAAALTFTNTWFDPSTLLEWGVHPPWTTIPLKEWTTGGQTVALNLDQALTAGTIPEAVVPGMGCSRELLQTYLDFRGKHQSLLERALNMAWGN